MTEIPDESERLPCGCGVQWTTDAFGRRIRVVTKCMNAWMDLGHGDPTEETHG